MTDKMEMYLSFGSNLGDRKENILKAVKMVEEGLETRLLRLSEIIETKPWGFESDNNFLNAVGVFEVEKDTKEYGYHVLDEIKKIEKELGRCDAPEYDSEGKRVYHSRTIDIDILYLGDLNMKEGKLTIPHPLIGKRDFVKIPLKQVKN